MKKLSIIFCAAIVLLGFTSCFTDSTDYYVKYVAKVDVDGYASISYVAESQYTYVSEKGPETVDLTNKSNWSTTIGPLKKGFVASLSGYAVVVNASSAPMTLGIYVCRGDEPFVLKAQQVSEKKLDHKNSISTSVSYTIE